jgi:hypothetical protein
MLTPESLLLGARLGLEIDILDLRLGIWVA